LSLEHRETVDLAIFENFEVVYLQVIESPQRIKIAAAPGERLPAFCTATGKAFLAYLPDAQVRKIFEQGVRKYTNRTNLSLGELCQSLRHVRDQGFAIAEEEYEEGVNAVAAPILDHHCCPIAAIAVVGPAFRLPGERMKRIGKSVKATAEQIAQEIATPHRWD
jgi:DNA-binding IclR family transcriptional regulator